MTNKFHFVLPAIALLLLLSCAGAAYRKDAESGEAEQRTMNQWEVNAASIEGAEMIISPGDDIVAIFKKLRSDNNIRKISFTPGDYVIVDTLVLPRTGSLVIIEGNGANLKAKGNIPIFHSVPTNQSQAMEWNKTRYLIQNFGQISGGSRGIMIGSSFNTTIRNIEFVGQQEAAIDLIFCLMSTLEQILVTNVAKDGIVLRSGVDINGKVPAWKGASFNNSQCNHSKLQSCRVYNKKGCDGSSFKILQSTGVRLVDCISEGWPNKRAVFFDAEGCTTAKYFAIENFHLEHDPIEGGLCFRSFGSLVEVNGLFLQTSSKDSPAIWLINNGNYVFKNIPWWPSGAWVKSSHSPFIVIDQCAIGFYKVTENWVNDEKKGELIYPKYFRTSNELVR